MDAKKEAEIIRQYIADNRNKEAAERLCQWFEGKSTGRQNAALGLLNRVSALNDNILRGLISQADADLERNRITQALLDLTKQLDDTDPLPSVGGRFSLTAIAVAAAVVLAAVIGWIWFHKAPAPPPSFDLTVNLHGPGGESEVIRQGKVKLLLGDHFLSPKEINSEGQVFFDKISGEYYDQPVKLIPLEMRYKVVSQTARSASESRSISFELTPIPDTTLVHGIVFLPGPGNKPAAAAHLNINVGQAETTTDERGQFRVPVPVAAGATVNLMIDYKGRNRYNREITISSNKELLLTLNQ